MRSSEKAPKSRKQIFIGIGLLLICMAFLMVPLEYWYTFHHAPDKMFTATRGLAYQKVGLDSVFDIILFLNAFAFAAPGVILLIVGAFKNVIARFALPPVIWIAVFLLTAIEAGFLAAKWPNPVFPKDALKVHRDELKADEAAFREELRRSRPEHSGKTN